MSINKLLKLINNFEINCKKALANIEDPYLASKRSAEYQLSLLGLTLDQIKEAGSQHKDILDIINEKTTLLNKAKSLAYQRLGDSKEYLKIQDAFFDLYDRIADNEEEIFFIKKPGPYVPEMQVPEHVMERFFPKRKIEESEEEFDILSVGDKVLYKPDYGPRVPATIEYMDPISTNSMYRKCRVQLEDGTSLETSRHRLTSRAYNLYQKAILLNKLANNYQLSIKKISKSRSNR